MTAALYPVKIGVLSEINPDEQRVALTPQVAAQLSFPHFRVMLQAGAGARVGFTDTDYRQVGVGIEQERRNVLSQADVVLSIQPLHLEDVESLRSGVVLISSLQPTADAPLIQALTARGVTVFSLDFLPDIDGDHRRRDAMADVAGSTAYSACQDYAQRIVHLLTHIIHHGKLKVDVTDEITRDCCLAYAWKIIDRQPSQAKIPALVASVPVKRSLLALPVISD